MQQTSYLRVSSQFLNQCSRSYVVLLVIGSQAYPTQRTAALLL
jgi:hypothetical protein